MYTLITHAGGVTVEAIIMAVSGNRMRIAIQGLPDCCELRRVGAQWLDESGNPVDFEFLMSNSSLGAGESPAIGAARVRAAGSRA